MGDWTYDGGTPQLPPSQLVHISYRSDRPIEPVFHSHPFYEVYYFHSGKCNYLIGDRIYVLAPGDLILMNGMTLHCPKIGPDVPYIRTTIHFNSSGMLPLLQLSGSINFLKPFQELGNYRLRLHGEDRVRIEQRLLQMHELQQRGDELGSNRCALAFADLLYLIYELCELPLSDKKEQSYDRESTVQAIITYVEAHYTESFGLDDLGAELHMSKHYLSKLFKEVTGVTIFDYVYQRRINQAKIMLLLDGSLSLTEVSYSLGFKHLAHFSRVFKRQIGQTPERYRRLVNSSLL
ncbi:AraC family transcriptional regulator [Paenibacillus sp. GCM10023252]|uniref:AraC family transcriptional regulator n=1 Tax=Paenibacillus sp. GCM10023252 TaxID=3252649 RepID=UPI00360B8A5C